MGWFDTPAISVRKQIPENTHAKLSEVEQFADHYLSANGKHQYRYQIGIVLASWAKVAIQAGDISVSSRCERNIHSVCESCVKTLRSDAYPAFRVLEELADQGGLYATPSELFRALGANVLMGQTHCGG